MVKKECLLAKQKIIAVVLYMLITMIFYLFLFYHYTPVFGINDDWTIYMALSGGYTGEPSPYVLFILYPLAWLISKLYGITYQIPWYGILLHGCFILSGLCVFMRFYERIHGSVRRIIVSGLAISVYWISNLQILIAIQYTHSAAVCGAAAVIMFLTSDIKDKNWKQAVLQNLSSFFLLILSVCIRQNAAFMCIPVAGMAMVAKYMIEERKISINSLKKYGAVVGSVCIIIAALLGCQKIAYSSQEWSEYSKINYYREKVVDFYGDVNYEVMQDVAEKAGIAPAEYEIRQGMLNFYNGAIPYSEFYEIVMERSKEIYDREHPLQERFLLANEQMKNAIRDSYIWPQNGLVILLFAFIVIMLLLKKNLSGVVLLGCVLFGRFFAWYYILFNGRFPLRIPQCLFAIDLLMLLGILLYCDILNEDETDNSSRKIIAWFTRGVSVAAVGVMLIISFKGIGYADSNFSYISIYQDRWYGIKEYCGEHPENMYLLNGGSQTLYYYSDNVFENNTIGPLQNYYSPSNFYSISPNFYVKTGFEPGGDNAEAMLDQENNLWIYEKGMFSENIVPVSYFKERFESFTYELVDTFETKTGSFEVYRMTK